jgi:serine/threonine-protein kinase
MLTTRPPFPDGTVLQKLLQHNSEAPPDPRELNPTLPDEVSIVVRRMLAKDPRRRPQHPRDLINDLYLLAEQVGFAVSGGKDPHWVPSAAAKPSFIRRNVAWMVPVAALVACVVLLDYLGPTLDSLAGAPADGMNVDVSPPWPLSAVSPTATAPMSVPPSEPAGSGVPGGQAGAVSPKNAAGGAASSNAPQTTIGKGDEILDAQGRPTPPTPGKASADDKPHAASTKSDVAGAKRALPAAAPNDDNPGEPSADELDDSSADGERSAPMPGTKRPAADVEHGSTVDAPPAQLPPGLLVVCDKTRGEGYHASLRAACAAAKNGDVIELRYDGPRDETPFTLSNLRLTIRAGEKFQPAIVFRPSDTDTVAYSRSMITVAGGGLALLGVALELDMPRTLLSENWALIETQRADSVVLEHCFVTVRNASDQRGAYHLDVSMFDVKAAPGSDAMLLAMGMPALEPVKIELRDCVVRGEAVFLHSNDLQPLSLSWSNGLLATSERLLAGGGGASAPPQGVGQVHLDLRHVTAAVGKGFCRLGASNSAPWLLDTEIQVADCIIVGGEKDASLVEQLGADRVPNLQRRVAWRGDHNVYQGFDGYWKVTDLTSAAAPLSFSFEQWTAYWATNEVRPSGASVSWAHPPAADQPIHRRGPSDYVIDPRQDSAVVSGASDGGPLGLIAERLPGEPATGPKR